MIGRALLVSLVVCFLSLTSLPAFSLTPTPINGYIAVGTLNKIIVRVTPDANGQARYWWYKVKVTFSDPLQSTIYCGKHDLWSQNTQEATGQDMSLYAYVSNQWYNDTTGESAAPMSATDSAWCLQ
jgi:hypothetical protein